jgi:hypothetical protein
MKAEKAREEEAERDDSRADRALRAFERRMEDVSPQIESALEDSGGMADKGLRLLRHQFDVEHEQLRERGGPSCRGREKR